MQERRRGGVRYAEHCQNLQAENAKVSFFKNSHERTLPISTPSYQKKEAP